MFCPMSFCTMPAVMALTAHVPPPVPDVIEVPPPPHPVPPSPDGEPPEVIDPTLPGEHPPVREPHAPVPQAIH
jgi:hypothetical protein